MPSKEKMSEKKKGGVGIIAGHRQSILTKGHFKDTQRNENEEDMVLWDIVRPYLGK